MTRSATLAEEARASYTSLAAEHLSKLFLRAHEVSLVDDASMAAAVSKWLHKKEYERLDTELDKLSTYCRLLRESIESSVVELDTLRSGVLSAIEAPSPINPLVAGSAHNEGIVTLDHDDVEVEIDKGVEALFAAGVSATVAAHAAVVSEISAKKALFDAGQLHSMLRYILEMGKPGTITSFTKTQILQMLNKCEAMLQDLPPKVQHDTRWVVEACGEGKQACDVVNEMIAAFIYSVDAKDCGCRTVKECLQRQLEDSVGNRKHQKNPKEPADHAALGWNGNHWAMMNWVDRVAADANAWASANEQTEKLIRDGVQFFAPLREVLNSGLKTFPTQPRVVFRGITVPVAHKYTLGTEVSFAPFTSTSLEGSEALKFMRKGGTYFVINTHSGALIADFSHYPEQAEALLGTNSEFVVTSKMSRTLQQILGNDFDVVFMSEKNSRLPPKDTIAQLVEGTRTTEFVYADYAKKYVEGRVSQDAPPSTSRSTTTSSALPLYKATTHFVNGSSLPFMLLLGAGGAGKTSALVGCLCHLMGLKTRHSRELLPLFVSLPSVGAALHQPGGLDRHMQQQLRLDDETFEMMPLEVRIVLLLDSLDEVAGTVETNSSILAQKLLDMNPWCASTRVIVSCRTEFLDAADANHTTVLSSDACKTLVYHVWPFDDKDRQTFMRQAASDRIEELARREADAQYKRLKDTFQLNDEQLSHPCVLYIATKVLSSLGDNIEDTAHNMYTLYDNFVRGSLSSLSASEEVAESVMKELRLVAHQMATTKVWHIPVQQIRDRLSSVGDCDELLSLIPSRCEDLHNSKSLWSFWHKTVAEFLAAQAIKDNPELAQQTESSMPSTDPQDAGVARMMQLGSTLDEYVFVPNPTNIREILREQLNHGQIKHIDMRAIIVEAKDLVDVASPSEPSCAVWCRKYLIGLQCKPCADGLRLSLPVFKSVKTLGSIELYVSTEDRKEDSVWQHVILDVRASFPSVAAFEPWCQISGCASVVWPKFPLVTELPSGFSAHWKCFPSPQLLPNVEVIKNDVNFSLHELNGGLAPNSYPKVAKMPRLSFQRCSHIVDFKQLPKHWLNTFVATEGVTAAEFAAIIEEQRPTTIDFRECDNVPLFTWLKHVDYPAEVLPPRWPSPSGSCLCFDTEIYNNWKLPATCQKIHLNFSESFSEYTELKRFEVKGCDVLIFPRLPELRSVSRDGGLPAVTLGATRVVFHPQTFSCMKELDLLFMKGTDQLKDLTLPQFPAVTSIENRALIFESLTRLEFAADSFHKCETIGPEVFFRMKYLEELVRVPQFKSVKSIGRMFFSLKSEVKASKLRIELPTDFLCNCKTIGEGFFSSIKCHELLLPPPTKPFLPQLETYSDLYFTWSSIDHVSNFDPENFLPKLKENASCSRQKAIEAMRSTTTAALKAREESDKKKPE